MQSDSKPYIGQMTGGYQLDQVRNKFYIAKDVVTDQYLDAKTLTFGYFMKFDHHPSGHDTYFDTREEAEACLAAYYALKAPLKFYTFSGQDVYSDIGYFEIHVVSKNQEIADRKARELLIELRRPDLLPDMSLQQTSDITPEAVIYHTVQRSI